MFSFLRTRDAHTNFRTLRTPYYPCFVRKIMTVLRTRTRTLIVPCFACSIPPCSVLEIIAVLKYFAMKKLPCPKIKIRNPIPTSLGAALGESYL